MGLVAVAPQLLQLFYTADSYNHSITSQSLQLCKRHQLHSQSADRHQRESAPDLESIHGSGLTIQITSKI